MDNFQEIDASDRRTYIASILGYDLNSPDGWPHELIDRLVGIRLEKGVDGLFREVDRLNGRS